MSEHSPEKRDPMWKETLRSKILTSLVGNPSEKNNAIEAVSFYYKRYAPKTLYKYYSDCDLNLQSVANNQVWLSAPCNFNDVFDSDISVNEPFFTNSLLGKVKSASNRHLSKNDQKKVNRVIHDCLATFRDNLDVMRSEIGVTCFSEVEDSSLMWAHYAENHHGFCVAYSLWDIMDKMSIMPIPIIYSRPRCCLSELNLLNIYSYIEELLLQSLTSKSPEWGYEQEWRIFRNKSQLGERWNAQNKGALLDHLSPRSINLGCAASEQLEREMVNLCSSRKIPLYKMEKDPIIYQLNKKPILIPDK